MKKMFQLLPALLAAVLIFNTTGCRSVYYSAYEKVGVYKRDLLKKRVSEARNDQQAAQQQFKDALTRLKEITSFDGGEAERAYRQLKSEYDACASRAETVRSRIRAVESVASDLFVEWDNENGQNTNHIRYIRTYATSYAFPQDVWSWSVIQPGNGNPYPNPGLASTNIVEPSFGNLAIGAPSGGMFPITWLGRPAVVLQTQSSLNGVWTDVIGTDGTQSTNIPNSGGNQFFRLKKNP